MSEEKKQTKKVENEEEVVLNEGENNIEISDDVVAVIAGMAASEVSGVAEMAGGFAGGISEVLSGKKNLAKGIKVEIQKRVKKSVENMTGLNVLEVNVHVQGVSTVQLEDKKQEESKAEEKVEEQKKETKKK